MKRSLRFFGLLVIAVLFLLCVFQQPSTARAAESYTSGDYTYTVTNGKATIIAVNHDISGKIVVPSVLDGYPVTAIGDDAFSWCKNLTSVTIGDGVTSIGGHAFEHCTSLTSIVLPSNLTSLASSVFYNCTSLTSIDIPDSVTSIGYRAFYNCTSLATVTIGDGVEAVGVDAFHTCTSLNNVVIPDSVTFISNRAFYRCASLSGIDIPESVTVIGEEAFSQCGKLTGVWVCAENANYSSDSHGVLFDKGKTKLIQVPGGMSGSYEIPGSVTVIGDNAFSKCEKLTSITIPNSVTTLGTSAFSSCTALTGITIPDSVTTVGSRAFYGCTNLSNATIGNGVTTIDYYSFYDCTNLTTVNMGNSVATIGSSAFEGCASLTTVNMGNSVTTIGSMAFCDCYSLAGIVLPDGVTTVDYRAFYGCRSLTDITISVSVTSFGIYAFANLKGATIYYKGTSAQWDSIAKAADWDSGSTYTLICLGDPQPSQGLDFTLSEDGTYYIVSDIGSCKDTDLQIPAVYKGLPVQEIGRYAFDDCVQLISVTIPDSVTRIGISAFQDCANLTRAVVPDSVVWMDKYVFYNCPKLADVSIPKGVASLEEGIFWNCDSLVHVVIPEGVERLHFGAFQMCDGLISIVIPKSVVYIEAWTFSHVENLDHVLYTGTQTQWEEIDVESHNELHDVTIWHYAAEGDEVYYRNSCAGEGWYCTLCGKHLTGEASGDACNYTASETIAPTCVKRGYTVYVCTVCGDQCKGSYVEPTGSHISGSSVVTAPTCEEDGYTTHTCSVCGDSYVTDYTDAIGHSYDNDCDLDCNTCGEGRTVEHDYADTWSYDESCHYHACSVCGEPEEEIPHDFEDGICEVCRYERAAMKIGDKTYSTLKKALAAASAGDTLILLMDLEVESVALARGVTLDLNGFTLTVEHLVAFVGNKICDSAGGGLLKCRYTKLDVNNPMMPVWVEADGGYRFFTMKDSQLYLSQSESGFVFIAKPVLGKAANAPYMALAGNGLSVKARMSWKSAGGNDVEQFFVLKGEDVQKIYSDANQIIQLTVNGAGSYIGRLSTTMVIESETGVIWAGVPLLYTGN